ncbi:hypothetical protein AB4305_00225 [Nocardia sp. 2YAB30]|uniref:hypothetical protein n=1 Tax=unclassified Nocardia TaxID=2637762 RepID=UPI003F94369F
MDDEAAERIEGGLDALQVLEDIGVRRATARMGEAIGGMWVGHRAQLARMAEWSAVGWSPGLWSRRVPGRPPPPVPEEGNRRRGVVQIS